MNKFLTAVLVLALFFSINDMISILKLKREEKEINEYFSVFCKFQEEENARALTSIELGIELRPERNKPIRDSLLKYKIGENFPLEVFNSNADKYKKLMETSKQLQISLAWMYGYSYDVFLRYFLSKNIKNDSIYFGTSEYTSRTRIYELFINNKQYEYPNYSDTFKLNPKDTIYIKMKKIEINSNYTAIDTITRTLTYYPDKNHPLPACK